MNEMRLAHAEIAENAELQTCLTQSALSFLSEAPKRGFGEGTLAQYSLLTKTGRRKISLCDLCALCVKLSSLVS